jgi:hypothetical protein
MARATGEAALRVNATMAPPRGRFTGTKTVDVSCWGTSWRSNWRSSRAKTVLISIWPMPMPRQRCAPPPILRARRQEPFGLKALGLVEVLRHPMGVRNGQDDEPARRDRVARECERLVHAPQQHRGGRMQAQRLFDHGVEVGHRAQILHPHRRGAVDAAGIGLHLSAHALEDGGMP